ncbi:MAG: AAA family ATPase [Aminobacterium sp.]|jgi:wobble nucleotide-excising tRNase|uniref:AAA family ATPase n=1 Tax=Aminobacterium sp. TaxID=1872491 RepID=UPI002B21876E|nr:AAA family ATPase [Aminobacterium sp.]MEA4877306.1 AAA family ATPase [Aminobacterium sp.]
MLEELSGIRVKGQFFSEEKVLKFFPPEKRLAILYGKNGSGKSSISRAIYSLAHSEEEESRDLLNFETKNFINNDGEFLTFGDNQFQIKIFNENYVDKKIKIKTEGLDSIVMFGEQIKIDKEIGSKKENVQKISENLDKDREKLKNYKENGSVQAPSYYKGKIEKSLKEENGWANLDKEIKGNKIATSVTDSLIEEIGLRNPVEEREALKSDFERKLDKFKKLKQGGSLMNDPILSVTVKPDIDKKVSEALSVQIKEPILTEREKLIFKSLIDGHQKRIEEARIQFSDKNALVCPFCFQSLTDGYRKSLLGCFEKVLNKDVEEHKRDLRELEPERIVFDVNLYQKLSERLLGEIEEKLQYCNEIIDSYSKSIDQKVENIYSPINIIDRHLENNINQLNLKLKELEVEREDYNANINDINALKDELIVMNKDIASYRVREDWLNYQRQLEEMKSIEERIAKSEKLIKNEQDSIKKLQQQKSNIKIALDYINNSLAYVFFSRKRMIVELGENNAYLLKVCGKMLSPEKISCGERNILALCYFFSEIFNNFNENDIYSKPMLLVLDDPVSSFDFENKVGIHSYLKYEIVRVLKGNSSSKILLMSHDLEAIQAFSKLNRDLKTLLGCNTVFVSELSSQKIRNFKVEERNEYSKLLDNIYAYAKDTTSNDLAIGNEMRRVLEAFTTFEYKTGFDQIVNDEQIMGQLDKRYYKEYFGNFVTRLVLHGESHYENRVKSGQGVGPYSFISEEEKVRTARGVLCLIYLLNPSHLAAYLKGQEKIHQIKDWCKEIEELCYR